LRRDLAHQRCDRPDEVLAIVGSTAAWSATPVAAALASRAQARGRTWFSDAVVIKEAKPFAAQRFVANQVRIP
jgi:hypothetical protein